MSKKHSQTQYIPIDDLHLLEKNPRQISTEEIERLKTSLKNLPDFFWARPCLVSNRLKKNVIIGGNMRYKAAKEIGLTEIPCHILEGLTESQEHEIIIKDNVQNGTWDYEELLESWDAIELKDWGVDIPSFEIPDTDFKEFNEDCANDVEMIECPKCKHKWPK